MKVEEIKKIAVMGAGDMGHGMAQVALMSGYKVAMRDIEQRFIDKGAQGIKDSLERFFVAKGKLTTEQRDELLNRLETTVKQFLKSWILRNQSTRTWTSLHQSMPFLRQTPRT